MKNLPFNLIRSKDIIGKKILSREMEDLGTIEEFVLNKSSGTIRYVVLAAGGFLGVGHDYYAVPWCILESTSKDANFKVNFSQSDIRNVPSFDKDHWPNFADARWDETTCEFYNHFVRQDSPMATEQLHFISEGGNSQPITRH